MSPKFTKNVKPPGEVRSFDTADLSGRHVTDQLLRQHGFTIAARPPKGHALWVRGGRYFPQDVAERIVAREQEAKKLLRGGTGV